MNTVSIQTKTAQTIFEHSCETGKYRDMIFQEIHAKGLNGVCKFHIIDIESGQLWIGNYAVRTNSRMHINTPTPSLLLSLQAIYNLESNYNNIICKAETTTAFSLDLSTGSAVTLLWIIDTSLLFKNGETFPSFFQMSHRPLPAATSILAAIHSHPLSDPRLKLFMQIKTEELCLLLLDELNKQQEAGFTTAMMEKMLEAGKIIGDNLETNYSIPQLAKQLHLSTTRLKSFFTLFYGCSVHQYGLKIKMQHAREQLLNTSRTAKDIGIELGFKNESNFSASFKNHYGYPPGYLRGKLKFP